MIEKIKKKRLAGVASLKKKADAAFSLYIRYRDGREAGDGWETQCITCGVWKPLKQMQNGHFVTRGTNRLRYSEQNCNAQCYSCNVMNHGEQYKYAKALDEKYGEGTAEKLMSQRHTTHKFTMTELEEIILETKAKLARYN